MKLDLEKIGIGLFFGGGLASWYHFDLGAYLIGIGIFCIVMSNSGKKDETEEEDELTHSEPEVHYKEIDGNIAMIDSEGNTLSVAVSNERKRIGSNK